MEVTTGNVSSCAPNFFSSASMLDFFSPRQSDQIFGQWPYREGANSHAKIMELGHQGSIPAPPGVVARTIVQAVQAKRHKTRYVTGGFARTMLFLRRVLSDRAFDAMFWMIERQMAKSKA
jgi:hypothetical protein